MRCGSACTRNSTHHNGEFALSLTSSGPPVPCGRAARPPLPLRLRLLRLFSSLPFSLLCSALLCSPATGTTARRPQSTRSLCCQPHSCLGCAAVVFRSPACGACASAQGAVCSPLAPPLLPQLAAVRRFLVTTGPPRGARKQPASHGWWVGSAALCLLSLASGPVLLLRSGVPIRPLRPRRWALGHSAGGASSN
jgi:hypothetical protein